jgi:predicted AAA+ superfamily ATPase
MPSTVIYGPRGSGKSTKLFELAASNPEPKRIILINQNAFRMWQQYGNNSINEALTTIYLFNARIADYSNTHIYLDDIEYYPTVLFDRILTYPWKSIIMTTTIGLDNNWKHCV